MKKLKFYVTTPIYYINDVPTVGNAYPTIVADILARWFRLKGYSVFYLTGLDENSIKTVRAAKTQGYTDIKEYVDSMAEKWKKVWKELKISYDGFIRTTESRHKKAVAEFFMKVFEAGDIYKGRYNGLYCTGCETFLAESDLENGLCPFHKTRPEYISEDNYFFRLSRYQQKLLEHIENNKEFIKPETRRNEVLSVLRAGLKDISISRPGLEWGISLPVEKTHRFWVWFDALLNYISGVDEKLWPADLHIIGKDIIRFHCLLWPAMLLSAGYKVPRSIFAHGFFTVNGQKMSKSLGNAIDPVFISNKYSSDALRYFLIREIPFGEDGDFSQETLKERINGELVSDLGNLVNRVLTLCEKYDGRIEGKPELERQLDLEKIVKFMDNMELHHAIMEIFNFARACNKYINDKRPWALKGEELGQVLYNLLEALKIISILTSPFLPDSSEKINSQLGVRPGLLKDCRFRLFVGKPKKGDMLFRKVQ